MNVEKIIRLVILAECGRPIYTQYMDVVTGGESISEQNVFAIKSIRSILKQLKPNLEKSEWTRVNNMFN
jgi:hypothetical protein